MSNKHFNPKTEPTLRDTLSFTANGKDYSVVHLTDDAMAQIAEIAENADLTPGVSLSRQLAVFAGADPDEFSGVDFREKAAIVGFITENITDPLGNRKQRRDARR